LVETEASIQEINDRLGDAPFKLALVPTEQLALLEKNARFMKSETFRNLVANIKKDGAPSSIPFCVKEGEKFKVLSGNHRVMATREAGFEQMVIMYTEKPLSRSEEVAIQLSHNSLVGEDDPIVLQDLWDEIEQVEMKFYSGLDDKIMEDLEKLSLQALSEVDLEYRLLTFMFLPEEAERLQEIFEKAVSLVSCDEAHLVTKGDFDRLIDGMDKTRASYGVHNSATALGLILDVFGNHMDDLTEGWLDDEDEPIRKNEWVPLASIFGNDKVPASAGAIIKKALDRMLSSGEVGKKNAWQALEYWAAEYLAGGEST